MRRKAAWLVKGTEIVQFGYREEWREAGGYQAQAWEALCAATEQGNVDFILYGGGFVSLLYKAT